MDVAPPRAWNRAPAFRLLLPLSVGIYLQWEVQMLPAVPIGLGAASLFFLLWYRSLSLGQQFRLSPLNGCFFHLLFVAAGAAMTWMGDPRHTATWIGRDNHSPGATEIEIESQPVERAHSFKSLTTAKRNYRGTTARMVSGGVIVYFKKDALVQRLRPGTRLLTWTPLQEIRNSGNPGTFDFKRYSLFAGYTHQVYLAPADYRVLPETRHRWLRERLDASRRAVIGIIRQYIRGPREQGLAEALLIGYKDDLDKALIQSYANTGVVHVIAISGLHLGIIYWLLLLLTKLLQGRRTQILRLALVVAGLWAFTLLAGAQPSVLRSAVMFTGIAWSTVIRRKTSIYNSLALSALLLLFYNPYWLWDAGFQLSYLAVLGIVMAYRPVYSAVSFSNRVVDHCWRLLAGSTAAQLLTFPVSIYHFHQFPLIFLFANLVAIPLSSLILTGEILLCTLSFSPPAAAGLGHLLGGLIRMMNAAVEHMNRVPFSAWTAMSLSFFQTALLHGLLACTGYWLLERNTRALLAALVVILLFTGLRTGSFVSSVQQRTIIIYQVPRLRAVDLFSGRSCFSANDAAIEENPLLYNFHVAPARVLHRVAQQERIVHPSFSYMNRHILLVDTTYRLKAATLRPVIDLLVLSRNGKTGVHTLAAAFTLRQVVIDASVPAWRAQQWERECRLLRIPCHNISRDGAFVMRWQTPTFAHLHKKFL